MYQNQKFHILNFSHEFFIMAGLSETSFISKQVVNEDPINLEEGD